MDTTLYSELISRQPDPILPLTLRTNLSVKERQTIYRLNFGKKCLNAGFQVDGKLITTGNRCDYLILANQPIDPMEERWQAVFVELKGTDVPHALIQLDATLSNPLFRNAKVKEKHARIVAKSFPANKANPRFEKAKREFKSKHNCSLKQITSGKPDLLS